MRRDGITWRRSAATAADPSVPKEGIGDGDARESAVAGGTQRRSVGMIDADARCRHSSVWLRSRLGPTYMSPRMSSPRRPFFFSFFLLGLSLVRPRRRLSPAPTAYSQGRRAQMLSRLAASSAATTLWGAWPLQQSSTTAGLMGRGRVHSCLLFICLECQRALFR